MKSCSKCGISKDLDCFSPRPHSRDGRRASCKECMAKYNRERLAAMPGEGFARTKRWRMNHPDQVRESDRKRRQANPDKFREKYRRQYAAHSEERAAAARSRRQKDPDKYNATVRARRQSDPSGNRAANHKRRVSKIGISASVTAADIRNQFAAQGQRCYYCWTFLGLIGYEVDHFIALAQGGRHSPDNIVIACRPCNLSKNKFDAFAYFKKIGVKVEPIRRQS